MTRKQSPLSVSGYERFQVIHRGTRSTVYRGRRVADGLPVVLKVLNRDHPNPTDLARFGQEYAMLRAAASDRVVRVFELVHTTTQLVLVEDDIDGEALATWIRSARRSLECTLPVAVEVARAVREIHRCGVIHKDLNPSNMVWNQARAQLRIIDFDLAVRATRERQQFAGLRHIEGTLPYLAPEQTGCVNRDVDERSDLYAVGATLYELFTGQLPFDTTDARATVHAHLAKQPTPLYERNVSIPRVLSDVVIKLLDKSQEARYQSADGLVRDLERCADEWRETGAITAFELAVHDLRDRFRLPQHLYGRKSAIARLRAAFDRVAAGGCELALVAGPAGIGKSALVHEVQRIVSAARGMYVSGKYDQLRRHQPYSAVVHAFSQICHLLLAEESDTLAHWQCELRAVLGHNSGVITELVPAMNEILGQHARTPELGPAETKNRLLLTVRAMLRVLCRADHPVVIHLDDLQWADLGSIELVRELLIEDSPGHLLLIGSYRDGEIDAGHPLIETIDILVDKGKVREQVKPRPLGVDDVSSLIVDAFQPARDCTTLATVIVAKTGGNPFVITQFLRVLYERGFLGYRFESSGWDWNEDGIQTLPVSDNVVELLVDKLHTYAEETRRFIAKAALLGNRFSLDILEQLDERVGTRLQMTTKAAALAPALADGLLVGDPKSRRLSDDPAQGLSYRTYMFQHDRVQQAAASLLDDADRREIHSQIGKVLLSQGATSDRDRLFEIVEHLNKARLRDAGPDVVLARMDLEAALEAKRSTAYAVAAEFLDWGIDALPERVWPAHRQLAYLLCRERYEIGYLLGHGDADAIWAERAREQAETDLERARVYSLELNRLSMQANYEGALEQAFIASRLLGVPISRERLDEDIVSAFARIDALLANRTVAAILDAPLMTDERMQFVMALLSNMQPLAYIADSRLFTLSVLIAVELSLEHGNAPESAPAFACLGLLFCVERNDYHRGYDFGQLGITLGERFDDLAQRSKAYDFYCNFVHWWTQPIGALSDSTRTAFELALASGELPFSGYIAAHRVFNDFYAGRPLGQVLALADELYRFSHRIGNEYAYCSILGAIEGMRVLVSEAQLPTGVLGYIQGDETFIDTCVNHDRHVPVCRFAVIRAQTSSLRGDFADALRAVMLANDHVAFIFGMISHPQLSFYHGLAVAGCQTAGCQITESDRLAFDDARDRLAGLAETGPANFLHLSLILEAEHARLGGDWWAAKELYDCAIARAYEQGFIQDAALACLRAADGWRAQDKPRFANAYLRESHSALNGWGAYAEADFLSGQHPRILGRGQRNITQRATHARSSTGTGATTGTVSLNAALDINEFIRFTRAISEEVLPERMAQRLLAIVIEVAGAERAWLLQMRESELWVTAVGDVGGQGVRVVYRGFERHASDAPAAAFARSIVSSAVDRDEPVVVGDARTHDDFRFDPAVRARATRSALAIPLTSRGRRLGALYLENNLLEDGFTPARLGMLTALSGQIVTAIENSQLYGELDDRVQRRTAELRQALKDLETVQKQLVETAHQAGMVEISTSVLHNVGNVLNSLNLSAGNLREQLASSRLGMIGQLAEVFSEHESELARFVVEDERGRKLPTFLRALAEQFAQEHGALADELTRVVKHVEHIKHIIVVQQSYAVAARFLEQIPLRQLIDDAIELCSPELNRHGVTLHRDMPAFLPVCHLEKHKALQILINLIGNAKHALAENPAGEKNLTVRARCIDGMQCVIDIIDDGCGISADNLTRLFSHGFTTRRGGRGLGLHTSSLSARALGGGLIVHSDGPGHGARFTFTFPVDQRPPALSRS